MFSRASFPRSRELIRKSVLAAFLLCVTPTVSGAATIDFTGIGRAEVVTVAGVRSVTAWAGELNWSWLSGQPSGSPNSFYTYCVDLLSNATDPQSSVTVRSTDEMTTATVNGAQKAAWLFNTYAPIVHGAYGTSALGAGLQLAIWEVLYDNSLNLGVGNFRVSSASSGAMAAGNYFLSALTAVGAGYLSADATWLDSPTTLPGQPSLGQDQITAQVPEPASLILIGAGIAGAAAARRKRAAAKSTTV
jgi:hypothetical protein